VLDPDGDRDGADAKALAFEVSQQSAPALGPLRKAEMVEWSR
jgi:hypothetical protein